MRVPVRLVALVLVAGAALPAAAFVRETTSLGNPGAGAPLWWRCRDVTYRLNVTAAAYTACGDDPVLATSAAAAAFASWGDATRTGESASCTDFSFVNGGATTVQAVGKDGVNLVVVRNKRCLDPDIACSGADYACGAAHNCWEWGLGTIGLTTLSWSNTTGEILDADMELFGWDGTVAGRGIGNYFTCQGDGSTSCAVWGDPGCTSTDFQAVVTHEAGHMLGLDHVCQYGAPYDPAGACSTDSVMVPNVGAVAQRTLAQDDVRGVCAIYPWGGPQSCEAPPKKSSGGGCASAGGAGILALLGALGVLRRPRSRRP